VQQVAPDGAQVLLAQTTGVAAGQKEPLPVQTAPDGAQLPSAQQVLPDAQHWPLLHRIWGAVHVFGDEQPAAAVPQVASGQQ